MHEAREFSGKPGGHKHAYRKNLRPDQNDDLRPTPDNCDNIMKVANTKNGPNTLPRRARPEQSSGKGQTTFVDAMVTRPAQSC
jgi:hypothetical protein